MDMEIKKKEFKYKGKTLEELKTLDIREFAELLKSRPRRTALRQFQEIENFVKRAKNKLEKGKKTVKTHKRHLMIVPELIGMRLQIYNGREFIPVDVIEDMLGHKFGEFALTRARIKHTKGGVGATKGTKSKSKN